MIRLIASMLCVATMSSVAVAQQGTFDPRYHAPVPGGDANLVNVHGADVLQHLRVSVGLYLDYAKQPLQLQLDDGSEIALVDDELRLDVLAAVGFFKVLELGVALPLILTRSGADDFPSLTSVEGTKVGDLRLVPKWRIVDHAGPLSLALAVPLTFPTGRGEYLASNDGVSVEPRLVLELDAGRLRVMGNVGYRIQPEATLYDLEVGNSLRFGLGLAVEVASGLSIIGEGLAQLPQDGDAPAELGAGLRYGLSGHAVTALAGFGIGEGPGAPTWHVTLGYTFTQAKPGDRDHDGIIDTEDACPDEPEDSDGFRDADGCPDLDNDNDGVVDTEDGPRDASGFGSCRDVPEDKDGRDDLDGCPDLDDDGDGIPDLVDGPKDERGFGSCKDVPEDMDGFEDTDGCPDPDNDQDGILDIVDGPKDPNDKSGLGSCRDQAETMNGYQDLDGCPDVKRAQIGETSIDLYDTVLFETGKDRLLPESDDLLNQVAGILREHPEVVKVEIAGHTDEIAGKAYNQKLSERRAQRVLDYLLGKGIEAKRLTAKGYGETQPLSKDKTPEALKKNRRVEFRILQRAKVP